MTTVAESLNRLDKIARDLDECGVQLAETESNLEPVALAYEDFCMHHEIGLWQKHEDKEAKWPSERVRTRLAHAAMAPELLGEYVGLDAARKRLEKRIARLKIQADAERSILSALKVEMEATMARHG